MEWMCFYFFQILGNKGFKISCATPNWRMFFLKLRATEQMNARRLVCIVIFKYDYANETANIHSLRLSLFLCLSVFVFYCISQYFKVLP